MEKHLEPETSSGQETEASGDTADRGKPSADEENFIVVREPDAEPDNETVNIVLWGRIGSRGETETLAVYWEVDPGSLGKSSDDSGPESEDPDSPLVEDLFVSLQPGRDAKNFDPSRDRETFLNNLLGYSLDQGAVPKLTIEEYQSELKDYLNETRLNWLADFTQNESEDDLKNWIEPLLEELFPGGLNYYQLNVRFAPPGTRSEEDGLEDQSSLSDTGEGSRDDGDDPSKLSVSFINNPSEGTKAPDISMGMDVYFRLVGSAVEHLPEHLVEEDRSNPKSIPLVGPVVAIDDQPEISEELDSEPENYREISVEIEPSVIGGGLVYKDDRIKIERDESGDDSDVSTDLLILGGFVGILILMIIVILLF